MIWGRIRKSTRKEEEEFEKNLTEEKLGFKDKLAIVFSGFLVIVLPCLLVLLVLSVLICLMFGIF